MQMRALVILAALLATLAGRPSAAPAQPASALRVRVHVDFAQPVSRPSVSGFLLSLGVARPPDVVVAALRPRLIRTSNVNVYDRVRGLGARYELISSDLWGYPFQRGWLGKGPPYADFARYDAFVRDLARRFRGRPVLWDVWNEPNGGFWAGTREQLFETRAAWWAYRAYAQGAGSRVAARGTDPPVAVLASRRSDGPDRAQVLLGYWERGATPPTAGVRVRLANLDALPFLRGRPRARVELWRIPRTLEQPLAQPIRVRTRTLRIRRGSARLRVTGLPLHEAYRLIVRRA
jgi:hypothetical protein